MVSPRCGDDRVDRDDEQRRAPAPSAPAARSARRRRPRAPRSRPRRRSPRARSGSSRGRRPAPVSRDRRRGARRRPSAARPSRGVGERRPHPDPRTGRAIRASRRRRRRSGRRGRRASSSRPPRSTPVSSVPGHDPGRRLVTARGSRRPGPPRRPKRAHRLGRRVEGHRRQPPPARSKRANTPLVAGPSSSCAATRVGAHARPGPDQDPHRGPPSPPAPSGADARVDPFVGEPPATLPQAPRPLPQSTRTGSRLASRRHLRERLRPGADDGRDPHRSGPVTVVPPDPVAAAHPRSAAPAGDSIPLTKKNQSLVRPSLTCPDVPLIDCTKPPP